MTQMQEHVSKQVQIYTDGACAGNPGPGGWAALLVYIDGHQQRREKTITGYECRTTNNRMELSAAIRGLNSLREPCAVTLYSDSTYVVGIGTGTSRAVRNQDLVTALCAAIQRHGGVSACRRALRSCRERTGGHTRPNASRPRQTGLSSVR